MPQFEDRSIPAFVVASQPRGLPGDRRRQLKGKQLGDRLRIVAIDSAMHSAPLGECQQAKAPLQRLVGRQLGRGWRRALDEAMGGTTGCTHLRELLFNLATGAFQALPAVRDQRRRERGEPPIDGDTMPHFIDGCMTWRRTGPAVHRLFPQWAVEPPKG